METLTIAQSKRAALEGRVEAAVHGQAEAPVQKETKDGKPFWELTLADAEAKMTLRAWSAGPADAACGQLAARDFLANSGEFAQQSAFGLDARRWTCRVLTEEEREARLAGPPELRAKQAADCALLGESAASIGDPRRPGLARLFRGVCARRDDRAGVAGVSRAVAQASGWP